MPVQVIIYGHLSVTHFFRSNNNNQQKNKKKKKTLIFNRSKWKFSFIFNHKITRSIENLVDQYLKANSHMFSLKKKKGQLSHRFLFDLDLLDALRDKFF